MSPIPQAAQAALNVAPTSTETMWNVTIPQSSPLIQYSPSSTVTNPTDGWKTEYAGGETGQGVATVGKGASKIITQDDGATATFKFNGTAIYIHGRSTLDMLYTVTLDGQLIDDPRPSNLQYDQDTLVALTNLSRGGTHTVTLTTSIVPNGVVSIGNKRAAPPQLDLENVVFSTYSGIAGGNVVQETVANNDPAVVLAGLEPKQETRHPDFSGIIAESSSGPSWAAYSFDGSAIGITGSTGISQGRYQVTLDGKSTVYPAISRTFVPSTQLFLQTGLDPMERHMVNISSVGDGPLAVHQFQVGRVDGGTPMAFNLNLAPNTESPAPNFPLGPVLGGVLGGVALAALIIGFLIFSIRRRQKGQQAAGDIEAAKGPGPRSRRASGVYNSVILRLFPQAAPPPSELSSDVIAIEKDFAANQPQPQPILAVSIPTHRLSSTSSFGSEAHLIKDGASEITDTRPSSMASTINSTRARDDLSILTRAFVAGNGLTPVTGTAMMTRTAMGSAFAYPDPTHIVPAVPQSQRRLSLLPPPGDVVTRMGGGKKRSLSAGPAIVVSEEDMTDVLMSPAQPTRVPGAQFRYVHWAQPHVAEVGNTRS